MISIEKNGHVMVATLCRPPVNALNAEMVDRLDAVLSEACEHPDIGVLHIRSEQRAFCAGADLSLMQSCFATPDGPEQMLALVRRFQVLFDRIESAPVVTVAEIGATAMGGGLELALACDVRIAAFEARRGLTEIRRGLLPGAGGTQRLPRLCGRGVASRLILGGEVVGGEEAQRLGIVQWACPRTELDGRTREVVDRFAAMPKAALASNKACIALAGEPGGAGLAAELAGTRRLYGEAETRRRVAQFLGKSKRD